MFNKFLPENAQHSHQFFGVFVLSVVVLFVQKNECRSSFSIHVLKKVGVTIEAVTPTTGLSLLYEKNKN